MSEYVATKFSLATGRMLGSISGSLVDFLRDVDAATESVISGRWDGDTHYVVAGTATERPAIIAPASFTITADGVDAVAITDVPEGTEARVYDFGAHEEIATVVVDDGTFEWTTAFAGRFEVTMFPPFPHRPYRAGITADAP
jgi:hypothetical protein